MDTWDWALLGAASYVGVMTLVRMMRARRDQVVQHLREQVQHERERQQAEAQQQKSKQAEKSKHAAQRKEAA